MQHQKLLQGRGLKPGELPKKQTAVITCFTGDYSGVFVYKAINVKRN